MLISLCIPCHYRTYDLKKTMPYLLEAAGDSPPVEIVVIDYNSPDDLACYMKSVMVMPFPEGVSMTYGKYTGRDYYHMAHARNLSVLAAMGEYVIISSADLWFDSRLIDEVRQNIAEGCVWMCATNYSGVVGINRQEFIEAGGFDERFEFYGPEDRDLHLRMQRRGAKFGQITYKYIHNIPTPNEEKVKHYRLNIDKRHMALAMHPILEENIASGALVANDGKAWGQWL